MKREIIGLTCFLIALFFIDSCSVYMAAKHEGTTIEEAQTCKTRACLHSKGVEVISSEKNDCGELIETCKIMQKKGSTSRAVMHGILDVATIGIWEAAGTPIEGAAGEKKYFSVKVYYDKDENIKKIELLQ